MSVDEWFRRPKGQCCGPPAEPPLIMSAGRCVRMQMLRLWVEGWAARAQGLQMQLLRSAALHAAAATSPLTRAPTTGLMVDSWCLCCVAEDPRRLHYSNPPECRLLVVYQWLGGHYILAGSWVLMLCPSILRCRCMGFSMVRCQGQSGGTYELPRSVHRARNASDCCAFVTFEDACCQMHCNALLCGSWDPHF